MPRELEKVPITAVHDDDLKKAMETLGLLARMERGQILCKYCREAVSTANLYAYFPQGREMKFVCEGSACVGLFLEALEEGSITP